MAAMASEPKLIKVCLTNQGEDTETPWAHDLGPAPNAGAGARKVKLVNVPFMHAKPTWGDTIVVTPVADTFPTWDRGGVKWNEISSRIVEDGGRWAMILDYRPHDDVPPKDALDALARVCDVDRIVCEGAWIPRDADPGRAYLAVPKDAAVAAVMARLETAGLPMHLILVHPELKKSRAQTVVGVTPSQPRKPARPKTEKPIDEDLEPAPRTRTTTEPAAAPAKATSAKSKSVPASGPPAMPAPAAKTALAPVKKAVASATKKGAPAAKSAAPAAAAKNAAPAAATKKAVPVAKKAAPVAATKKAAPLAKKAAPAAAAKKAAPVTKKAAPAAATKKTAPLAKKTAPLAKKKAPAATSAPTAKKPPRR